jgi:hypothetical protein
MSNTTFPDRLAEQTYSVQVHLPVTVHALCSEQRFDIIYRQSQQGYPVTHLDTKRAILRNLISTLETVLEQGDPKMIHEAITATPIQGPEIYTRVDS